MYSISRYINENLLYLIRLNNIFMIYNSGRLENNFTTVLFQPKPNAQTWNVLAFLANHIR